MVHIQIGGNRPAYSTPASPLRDLSSAIAAVSVKRLGDAGCLR